jgi:hypothetical protein
MERRSVVVLGLGLWGLLAVATVYWGVETVERDLSRQSRADLAGAGLRWASVTFSGRDATLAGVAPSDDARARAGALLEELPGVGSVRDVATVEPAATN